ncbi:DUF998 domain-containing protein [Pseudonocardia sp. GCM10023141]|uniref:DUF998 domain-containing protein n=1 Tax=Pseudonocardia sp. GCM10023141 TaxID=3252653 RepID=UPI00361DD078
MSELMRESSKQTQAVTPSPVHAHHLHVGRRWWGFGTLLLALLALLAAARCAITMVYLGFHFSNVVNPITQPASYYVFVDGGAAQFTSAAVALALGTLAVLFGMVWAGAHLAGKPMVLFSVWAACLLLAAIFPTDNSPDITSFAGWVHQFAGGGILLFLSIAGFTAARRLTESPDWRPVVPTVRILSVGAAILAGAYVASRIVQVVPDAMVLFGGEDIGGILQRVAFGFDIAVVTALAVHLVRVSWLRLSDRTEPWTGGDPANPPTAHLGS